MTNVIVVDGGVAEAISGDVTVIDLDNDLDDYEYVFVVKLKGKGFTPSEAWDDACETFDRRWGGFDHIESITMIDEEVA